MNQADDQLRSGEDPHREQLEHLGAYALDLLEGDEAERVARHVEGCPRCRAELAELRPLGAALREVDPARLTSAPATPGELTPALEHVIAERLRAEPVAVAPVVQLRAHRRRLAVVGLAAAVVTLVAGVGGYQLGRPAPVPFESVAVSAPAAGPEATAGVIPHTWGMEIRLDAVGFTPGERYVVTVIDEAGARRDAGEFIGTGENPMICNLNSSVLRQDATGFEVTDDRDRVVLTSRF